MSVGGICGLAPAATAWLKILSQSSTYRLIVTGLVPFGAGAHEPMSGNSSARKRCESPIFSSAWPILPPGHGMHITAVAPNAFL